VESSRHDEFRVRVSAEGGVADVAASGELDVATAPDLAEALGMLIDDGTREVRVDLSGLTFMGSTGVNLLVGAARRLEERGGALRVTATSRPVLRVFEVSGVAERLGVVEG
jgi:anti-sigma B factor antagonist